MIVALGLSLNVATIILGCIFSILFSDFRVRVPISIPTPPIAALTEFFHEMQRQTSLHCRYRGIYYLFYEYICVLVYILCLWRCPWWNGYRRRKWTRRHESKSWTRLIAFHIALIPLGKVWIQLFSLQLWVNSRADWVIQPWWGN